MKIHRKLEDRIEFVADYVVDEGQLETGITPDCVYIVRQCKCDIKKRCRHEIKVPSAWCGIHRWVPPGTGKHDWKTKTVIVIMPAWMARQKGLIK